MNAVRRLRLVVHTGRPEAVAAGRAAEAWASDRGIAVEYVDVWADPPPGACPVDAAGPADLVITAGGDGTFLRGVRAAGGAPVLGVSVGRVGFLTEIAPEQLLTALDAVLAGAVRIEERVTLGMRASRPLEIPAQLHTLLTYGRGSQPPPPAPRPPTGGGGVEVDTIAVNDVVMEKLTRDRQASLAVYLDRRRFASYSADALIVASPTGSTAYSFAAGGPIVAPDVDALVLTPVAAHMVFDRSVVVPADQPIAVRVLDHSTPVAVTLDGQLTGVLSNGRRAAGRNRARPPVEIVFVIVPLLVYVVDLIIEPTVLIRRCRVTGADPSSATGSGREARSRREPLSRARIAAAALRVGDRSGIAGVTMRAVAADLRCDPMALYRHLTDKDDLLDAACDAVLADVAVPEPDPDRWVAQLRGCALAVRAALAGHAGVAAWFAARPPLGSHAVRIVDGLLAILEAAGHPPAEAARLLQALVSYTVGASAALATRKTDDAARAAEVRAAFTAAEPTRARARSAAAYISDRSSSAAFEYGLDLLLAGAVRNT